MNNEILAGRQQQVLYDKKWKKLLRRAWIFRHVPFVEFAFAAGSMALGNVKPESDFDMIVGVRKGRMFTARFFLIVMIDIFGWRRKNLDHGSAAADTICLNHFVTQDSLRLSEPHQEYWKKLYSNLVPVYGSQVEIREFWKANEDWASEHVYGDDLRHKWRRGSGLQRVLQLLLSGRIGDVIEKLLTKPQMNRIEQKLVPHAGYKPRLIYSKTELELHLDTRRIEEGVN